MSQKENDGKRGILWRTVFMWVFGILFSIAFYVSAVMLSLEMLRTRDEKNALDELAAIVAAAEKSTVEETAVERTQTSASGAEVQAPAGTEETAAEADAEPSVLPQYVELYERNPDLFGWLSIEGTIINYPVVYTPDDSEYYLRRAFDGTYARGGTLFDDGECPADAGYCLIYGHNMQNGSMFHSLLEYKNRSYWEEHPVICFDTLYEEREYKVVAAFYSRIYEKDDTGVFRYYAVKDLPDEETFTQYIRQVREAALYDTGCDVQYGDRILVLSTCSYHTEDGRFVVVARSKGE